MSQKALMYFVEDDFWHSEQTEILPNRQVLTSDYFDISGLELFGHARLTVTEDGVPLHYHKDNIEFTIVLKGKDFFTINGEEIVLSGGDVLIVNSGTYHKSSDFFEGIHEQYWFQINPNAPNLLNLSDEFSEKLRNKLKELSVSVFSVNNECLALAKKCFQSVLNKEDHLLQTSLFFSLLCQIIDFSSVVTNTDDKVQMIKDYIDTHYSEDLNIETICKEMKVSRSWLHQNFKKQTPIDYLNYRRIQKATELLKTDMSLTDIAFKIGFSSSSYFSTIFKKYQHQSPTEWRWNHKK